MRSVIFWVTRRVVAGVLGIVLSFSSLILAREPETGTAAGSGTIRGRVYDASGEKPLEGAVVRVHHLESGRSFASPPTTGKGDYEISLLPHGYMDVGIETTEGTFASNQVVNVPPGGRITVSFSLLRFSEVPSEWWSGREPRQMPGEQTPSIGVARVLTRPGGGSFWKSPGGLAVILGGSAAVILAIAAAGNDSNSSPSSP